MRELKFRQPRFSAKDNFVDWFYWGFIDNGFIAPLQLNVPNYQYTGLKDKNGKGDEAYQGDLIIYPNKYRNAGNPIEIIWKDGAWRGCYVNTDDTKFIFILNAKEMEDAVIIGNVHQPERMETPK